MTWRAVQQHPILGTVCDAQYPGRSSCQHLHECTHRSGTAGAHRSFSSSSSGGLQALLMRLYPGLCAMRLDIVACTSLQMRGCVVSVVGQRKAGGQCIGSVRGACGLTVQDGNLADAHFWVPIDEPTGNIRGRDSPTAARRMPAGAIHATPCGRQTSSRWAVLLHHQLAYWAG